MGMVQASEVTLQNSSAGIVRANEVALNGYAGVIVTGQARLGNTYAGVVAGGEVHGERLETVVLLARHVEGNVSTMLDTRGAVLAGLIGGLLAGVFLLLGRLLFGRKAK